MIILRIIQISLKYSNFIKMINSSTLLLNYVQEENYLIKSWNLNILVKKELQMFLNKLFPLSIIAINIALFIGNIKRI
jgi:hypothetical protein